MIYKLLNKLFGWDYILWEEYAGARGISKVFILPDGKFYYWRYRNIKCLDEIKYPEQVVWLTCKSDKYFKPLAKEESRNE